MVETNSTMKKILLMLICVCNVYLLSAQDFGVNLQLALSKRFKLSSKSRLTLQQRLQLNPEIERLGQRTDDELFKEFDLFPFELDDDDDDNDNDDDDEIDDQEPPFNDLNDEASVVRLDWRSSTGFAYEYRLVKWFRIRNTYALLWDADDIRHSWRLDFNLRPDLPTKAIDISQRLSFQLGGRNRRGAFIVSHNLSLRQGVQWNFTSNHRLYSNITVNGEWDEGKWEWDRLRIDTGLRYQLSDVQSIDFSFRYQQRLRDRKSVV